MLCKLILPRMDVQHEATRKDWSQMAREKEPFTVREYKDKVILTLDKTGWDPANAELLRIVFDFYAKGKPIAEFLGEAIRLKAKHHCGDGVDLPIGMAQDLVDTRLAAGLDPYGRSPRPDRTP